MKTRDGYLLVKNPRHHRAGTRGLVREHILIAERALGHPLPPHAVIHHHDGNPANNVPTNLVICEDRKYHNLLHARSRAFNETGDVEKLKCRFCKNWDDQPALEIFRVTALRRGANSAYLAVREQISHRDCYNEYQRSGYKKRRTE